MSTEEEKEELRLYQKYAQNSLFGMFLDQASIYAWMSEVAMKFGNVPNTIITILRRTSSRSIMDKVMEFNRCMDLKSEYYNEEDWKEENIVAKFKIDELHENKTIEITLEELKKELELKDDEELVEIPNGDFYVGIDTDSIWYSEMMQNPCPSHEEIEEAGDGPVEVGRQMHEAMERLGFGYENQYGSRIRVLPNFWRHRSCPGSVFLAHQERGICDRCDRTSCKESIKKEMREKGECPAYFPKKQREVIKEECCAVCEMVLDEPENFPKRFPDKWKVCCYCSEVWARFNGFRGEEHIHCGFNWLELKEKWEKFGKKFKEVFEL